MAEMPMNNYAAVFKVSHLRVFCPPKMFVIIISYETQNLNPNIVEN